MLKALRRHPLVRGLAEVLVDAVLYVGIMLIAILVFGQLATLVL
jgi:hypothetical protein